MRRATFASSIEEVFRIYRFTTSEIRAGDRSPEAVRVASYRGIMWSGSFLRKEIAWLDPLLASDLDPNTNRQGQRSADERRRCVLHGDYRKKGLVPSRTFYPFAITADGFS